MRISLRVSTILNHCTDRDLMRKFLLDSRTLSSKDLPLPNICARLCQATLIASWRCCSRCGTYRRRDKSRCTDGASLPSSSNKRQCKMNYNSNFWWRGSPNYGCINIPIRRDPERRDRSSDPAPLRKASWSFRPPASSQRSTPSESLAYASNWVPVKRSAISQSFLKNMRWFVRHWIKCDYSSLRPLWRTTARTGDALCLFFGEHDQRQKNLLMIAIWPMPLSL